MNDLKRIANALEHLALPTMTHDLKSCSICREKKKPVKRMPNSSVLTPARLIQREAEMARNRLLHGPEEPVVGFRDSFRYRELKET